MSGISLISGELWFSVYQRLSAALAWRLP